MSFASLPSGGADRAAANVALPEPARSHHVPAGPNLDDDRTAAIVDRDDPNPHRDALADGHWAFVGQLDPVTGGIFVRGQVPLDQEPPGLLDVPNNPSRR